MEARCGVDGRGAAGRQAPPGKGAEVTVCVSGAVQRPGLYRVPKGARVQEVLLLAGGYTFDADPDRSIWRGPARTGRTSAFPGCRKSSSGSDGNVRAAERPQGSFQEGDGLDEVFRPGEFVR